MYHVEYKSGQSRHGTDPVDYMLVDVDGVELYAEEAPVDGDETATYDSLKAQIIDQAKAAGIDLSQLSICDLEVE